MPGYHDYVFDVENRRFVGQFEEMYRAELQEGFDSWNQDDLASRNDIVMCQFLLEGLSYETIVDFGCGKGSLTAELTQHAKTSIGVDVSATAIEIATARHPFIRFEVANLTDEGVVDRLLREHFNKGNERKLVVLAQVLSYLPAWRNLLERIGSVGADVLILLYLPENPIGYVKNERELVASVQQQFKILNRQQDSGGHIAILARSNSALRME